MKSIQTIIATILLLVAAAACKKNDDGGYPAAILGSWRYTGSIIDSLNSGRSFTGYDSTAGPDLGDTLRFASPDTVYYTYLGSTTWSNYRVAGSQLILIGSSANDTLALHSLGGTQLQLGVATTFITYYFVYQKIAP